MKNLPLFLSLCLAGAVQAQTLLPEPKSDELPDSLLEQELFKPVIVSSPDETLVEKDAQPVKFPDEAPNVQSTADEGISIHVEKPAGANDGPVPTGDVKVYSPWPAKPMFPAPEGWKFAPAPQGLAPHRTVVTLSTGQEVSLAITPFVLVPITDGQKSIRILEPGYKPELGYTQQDTVSVVLQHANEDLERNEKQASDSIRKLQQLLSSLPKPPIKVSEPPSVSPVPPTEEAKP